eukprot:272737_1
MHNFHILSSNEYVVKFNHISNAIQHELYDIISQAFMRIVNDKTKAYKTTDEILTALRNRTKIDDCEIKYIQNLIQRTIRFFYPLKGVNVLYMSSMDFMDNNRIQICKDM